MKFLYEDVKVIFIDEISMVGSMKLAKINFRLQDLADGDNKLKFMGGISLVASGNYFLINYLSLIKMINQIPMIAISTFIKLIDINCYIYCIFYDNLLCV